MNRKWPGRLVQVATILIVAAVAAATFVLSYDGVHAIALQAGVPVQLARYYPAVFDAVLVIACAAAPLRDARWWTRAYTWLVILVVTGLVGAMDAIHAMNVTLPRRQANGAVSVLPWVLLLLSFSLWLAILRHFRVQQARQVPDEAAGDGRDPASAPALPAAASPPALESAPETAAGIAGDTASEPAPETAPEHQLIVDYWEIADSGDSLDEVFPAGDETPGEDAGDDEPPTAEADAESGPEEAASEEAASDQADGESGPEEAPALPAIPYATGPRLRRIRSLPAPPVGED